MNRRNFIGSLLGTVAATALLPAENFFALPDTAEWQRVILPYRVLLRDSLSGFRIQAPGVERVQDFTSGQRFFVEPLRAQQSMRLDGVILMDERGNVIQESDFDLNGGLYLISGDSLAVTMDVNADAGSRSRYFNFQTGQTLTHWSI